MINLRKYLLPAMRQTNFWTYMADAIAAELDLFKAQLITPLLNYWKVYEDSTEEDLLNLQDLYGYASSRVVDSSLEFLRKDTGAIVPKVRAKSTYIGYDYFFAMIQKKGYVYNYMYNNLRLVKRINFSATVVKLDEYFTGTGGIIDLPFLDVIPLYYYDEFLEQEVALDVGLNLDEGGWNLDDNLNTVATKHLSVEYMIDAVSVFDPTKLLTPEYMVYLAENTAYNKKCTEIGITGATVTSLSSPDGFYNSISATPAYTISNLLLKMMFVPEYFDPIKPFGDSYKTLVLGTGSKALISNLTPAINGNNLLAYYNFDTYVTGEYLVESNLPSIGEIVVSGTGTYDQDGKINGAITLNGVDTSLQTPTLSLSDGTYYTFSVWFKGDVLGQAGTKATLIKFFNGEVYFDVNTITEIATLYFNIGGTTFIVDPTNLLDNAWHLFSVSINGNNSVTTFVDGYLPITTSIVGESITSTDNLYFGADPAANFFTGNIDEIRIYQAQLQAGDQDFLFNSLLASFEGLDNPVCSVQLAPEEQYDDSNYTIIQGYCKANSINDELVAVSDGLTNEYSGTLSQTNVNPKFLKISYQTGAGFITIIPTVDTNFALVGNAFTGNLTPSTGEYTFRFYRDYPVYNQLVSSDPGVAIINENLGNIAIQPNTLRLTYSVAGTRYSVTDNGVGGITGPGLISGTISYVTGQLQLEASSNFEGDIRVDYAYRLEDIPLNQTNIVIEYYVTEPIEITEAGILNDVGQLTVYATFPPLKFPTETFHQVNTNFILKK